MSDAGGIDPTLVLVVGGGMAMVMLLLSLSGGGASGATKKRLDRVAGQVKPLDTTTGPSLRRSTSDSGIPIFDRLIKALLPNPQKLRERITRAGLTLNLGTYLMFNALAIVIAYLVFAFGFHWSKPAAIFIGIAVGLYLPHYVIGSMGARRLKKFLASFPEAIDTICRGLRAGLPITESIANVGRELPDPVGIEFRAISDGVKVGKSLEDAMWDVEKRLDTPEYRFFIIALAIQRETGGNLAETLGNLGDLLRKRRQMRLKIKAMSSEAKASAMIIGSLPFLMFLLLMVVSSDYVTTLLNDPRGKIMLAGGGTWMSIGIFTMKNMINFEL